MLIPDCGNLHVDGRVLGDMMAITPRVVATVAAVLLVGACGSPDPPKTASRSDEDRDIATATRVSRELIEAEEADVSSATFTTSTGSVENSKSNTGNECLSGRLLKIKLIGTFPHIVTTGDPVVPGEPPPDVTVTAVLLTADATTGAICHRGVQTGRVEPEPGAMPLAIP